MNFLTKTLIMITFSLLIGTFTFAEDNKENKWEKDFIQALQKGKIVKKAKGGGLGYTLAQEEAEEKTLKKAIQKAMDSKAPPCEAMKIAVDMKYKAYSVIKNVFSSGGEVDLNQMCMCATEKGVNKQTIAQAAREAQTSDGKAVFMPDEVTQAQCLREIGLGYTTADAPDPIQPPDPPDPVSASGPTTTAAATPTSPPITATREN